MKITFYLLQAAICFIPLAAFSQKSIDQLHGDMINNRRGIHDGNQIRTTFGNDGNIGRRSAAERAGGTEFGVEWPVNSAHIYSSKIVMLPMGEVRDKFNKIQHIVSECHGTGTTWDYFLQASVGDLAPDGRWRTMTPLPGFINADMMLLPPDSAFPAMSDAPRSWPQFWPDKMNDPIDPGWQGEWNGYFGKGQIRADQESYWVTDDYQNDEFEFYQDEFDQQRRGLGLLMYYRGLQWSNPLVEDVMFVVYDVENVGTGTLDKINFGMHPDFDNGDLVGEWDPSPDSLMFDREEDWYYSFDIDNIGFNNFTPVGIIAYALFETPGNEFDGIDNDNDGFIYGGKLISEDDFSLGTLEFNTPIIIVDYQTYERTQTTLAALQQERPELFVGDTLVIDFIGRPQKFWPGKEREEVWFNNFDDNLNGLIDENNGAEVGQDPLTKEIRYLYVGYTGVDYFTGAGLNNPMLDESRKDGIDNDNDWTLRDDVGVDGKPDTGDFGEGDGMPTSKYQNGFVFDGPGEPHIDATDITESDMLGMTAFGANQGDWQEYPLKNDEILWNATIPGNMVEIGERIDNAFMGSGYFPMPSRHIERLSGAFMLNNEFEGLLRTKRNSEKAYENNYQFFRAPDRPKLSAVPGDGIVTLYWDDRAEFSIDPINGMDFEGYRIYRATDIDFKDMKRVTNAYGDDKFMVPIVQMDMDNGIKGLSAGVVEGVQFYLGDDTGLEHSWVDSNVVNGQRYFYLITSYDRGADSILVPPTECNFKLLLNPVSGEVQIKSSNIAIVTPNAPSAGYVAAPSDVPIEHVQGVSNSSLSLEIVDSPAIKDNTTYTVTFADTVLGYGASSKLTTTSITLRNKTEGYTLLENFSKVYTGDEFPVTEGFRLLLQNHGALQVDTSKTKFNRQGIYAPVFKPFFYRGNGTIRPADYRLEFGEIGIDTSLTFKPGRKTFPSMPVNFTITNLTDGEKIKFAFEEKDFDHDSSKGMLTFAQSGRKWKDIVYFLEKNEEDSLVTTWQLNLAESSNPADTLNPQAGDVLEFYTLKPFLSDDVYEFTTIGEKIDKTRASKDLDRIRVVPNPYVVTNTWERPNPYSSGRGPRELHFTHLPARCTIRIFDIVGQLVAIIERDADASDGTEVWDMLSKDQLEIGYGVYIYHIEAEGIGEKTGKFAIIK